jgi:hypothetical protein
MLFAQSVQFAMKNMKHLLTPDLEHDDWRSEDTSMLIVGLNDIKKNAHAS